MREFITHSFIDPPPSLSAKPRTHQPNLTNRSPRITRHKKTKTQIQDRQMHYRNMELNIEQEPIKTFKPVKKFLTLTPKMMNTKQFMARQSEPKYKSIMKKEESAEISKQKNLKPNLTSRLEPNKYRDEKGDILNWNQSVQEPYSQPSISQNIKLPQTHRTQRMVPTITLKKRLKSDEFYIKLKLKKTLNHNILARQQKMGNKKKGHPEFEVPHKQMTLQDRSEKQQQNIKKETIGRRLLHSLDQGSSNQNFVEIYNSKKKMKTQAYAQPQFPSLTMYHNHPIKLKSKPNKKPIFNYTIQEQNCRPWSPPSDQDFP